MKKKNGFSLIEIMIVLAIIALLTMIAMPNLMRFIAKAKRSEAYMQLRNLYLSEKTYFMEKQKYTTNLTGPDSLGWDVKAEDLYYTYGFSGSEGKNNIVGSLKTPASAFVSSYADKNGFSLAAAGDIDNDGKPDVLTINQNGKITIQTDDLE
jgi:prepilin-type N-terminal cleavage/methylation domain-containing protein